MISKDKNNQVSANTASGPKKRGRKPGSKNKSRRKSTKKVSALDALESELSAALKTVQKAKAAVAKELSSSGKEVTFTKVSVTDRDQVFKATSETHSNI